jgi:2,3-bisphosphoglycerate-independent phosphoglycerate mutase
MKILLIIIDGLGDRPIRRLGNRTPLDVAKTPNLDYMAEQGISGLITPFLFPKEKNPTSEGAHVALFGYKDYFLGRGPYEAAGVGMEMKKGDVALRVNFATVDKKLKILDRRAGRIEKTQPLIDTLSGIQIKGVKFLLKKSLSHRAVLILRGKNLSQKISANDPKIEGVKPKKIVPEDKSKQSKFTADVLNEFLEKAYQILNKHPLNKKRRKQGLLLANYLLVRGAGKFKKNPSFKKRYNLKSCCIAGGGLYKGVAKIIGMDLIDVKGATGLANTNLKAKFSAVKKQLTKYDFIFCHIKATDTFSHDGDFMGKKQFVEKVDKNIKSILNLRDVLIVVTADHSTCSELKNHCMEPIPVLMFGNGKDPINKFSEKFCAKGKLGKIKQENLMKTIFRLKD